jgi:integrase/recombinase XerD
MYNTKKNIDRRIHAHIFRHVWAKEMAQAEVDPYALKEMGGWNDLELVMHYASAYNRERAWREHERVTPINKYVRS